MYPWVLNIEQENRLCSVNIPVMDPYHFGNDLMKYDDQVMGLE